MILGQVNRPAAKLTQRPINPEFPRDAGSRLCDPKTAPFEPGLNEHTDALSPSA